MTKGGADSEPSSSVHSGSMPDDTFKILIATDIHLGYGEKQTNIGKEFLAGKSSQIVKLDIFLLYFS